MIDDPNDRQTDGYQADSYLNNNSPAAPTASREGGSLPPRYPATRGSFNNSPNDGRRRRSRNIQAAVMAAVVIICLVIFTLVALNSLRSSANPPETTSELTTSVPPVTDDQATTPTVTSIATTPAPTAPPTTPPVTTPPTTATPTVAAPYDFEEQYWGDTKTKVKATVKYAVVKETDTSILYNGKIQLPGMLSASNVSIVYRFEDGKLCRGEYLFTDKLITSGSLDGVKYLNLYDKLRASLTTLYGAGIEEQTHTCSKEDLNRIGQASALEYGYSRYTALWDTAKTTIELSLYSDQNTRDINVAIRYTKK